MTNQLVFDFPHRPAFGAEDFLVAPSNAEAIARIDRWPDWPSAALLLHGPAGCGKTHLAHLWCERASANLIAGETLTPATLPRLLEEGQCRIAIDDAERASERALLHLYNACVERQGSLLITVRHPPGLLEIMLGDLRS